MGFFSFLKGLFGGGESKSTLSGGASSGDLYNKKYDPKLVQSLKGDHQAVLGIFGRIQTAVQNHNDADLYAALQEFGTALKAHLALENVKFYSYIEEKYMEDPDLKKRIHHFRVEMEGIAVAVNRFLRAHTIPEQTPEQWASLPNDLAELAKALGKRIHDEETELYEMYKP